MMISLLATLLLIYETSATGDWQYGYASNYGDGNPYGNACGMQGTASAFDNKYYAAIGDTRFDSGYGCGKCWEVMCTGGDTVRGDNADCSCNTEKSLIIQGLDECSECTGVHAFDLTAIAMDYFTESRAMTETCGLISVKYRRVDCDPVEGGFVVTNKVGASFWYYMLHLSNVNGDGGIKYVELLKDGTSIATCDKSGGASFWLCNNGVKLGENENSIILPLDIKITSDLGETVTAAGCITALGGGIEMKCNTNLASGSSSGTTPSSPTTSTTPAPTTKSPTSSSGSSGSSGGKIQIKINTGSGPWWTAIQFPDNDNIQKGIIGVQYKDDTHPDWIDGVGQKWGNDHVIAYSFDAGGVKFGTNQDYRVFTNSGSAITENVFAAAPLSNKGDTGFLNYPGSSYTEEEESNTSKFPAVAMIAIILIIGIIGAVGIYWCWKRRQAKIQVSFDSGDGKNMTSGHDEDVGYDMGNIEVEANGNETTR